MEIMMNNIYKTSVEPVTETAPAWTANDLPLLQLELVAFDDKGQQELMSSAPLMRYVDDLPLAAETSTHLSATAKK